MSSDANGTTVPQQEAQVPADAAETKGKGKAVDPAPDVAMDEDDDDDDDEEEDPVSVNPLRVGPRLTDCAAERC